MTESVANAKLQLEGLVLLALIETARSRPPRGQARGPIAVTKFRSRNLQPAISRNLWRGQHVPMVCLLASRLQLGPGAICNRFRGTRSSVHATTYDAVLPPSSLFLGGFFWVESSWEE